eukprot:1607673-Rhodomonas_salina.2
MVRTLARVQAWNPSLMLMSLASSESVSARLAGVERIPPRKSKMSSVIHNTADASRRISVFESSSSYRSSSSEVQPCGVAPATPWIRKKRPAGPISCAAVPA